MANKEQLIVAYDHGENLEDNALRLVGHSTRLLQNAGGEFQAVLEDSEIRRAAVEELMHALKLIRDDNPEIVIAKTRIKLDDLLEQYGIGIANLHFVHEAADNMRLSAVDESDNLPTTLSVIPGRIDGARRMLLGYKVPTASAGGEELVVVSPQLTACLLSEENDIPKFLPDPSRKIRGPFERAVSPLVGTFGPGITLGASIPVRNRLDLIGNRKLPMGLLEPDFLDERERIGEACFARYLTHRAMVNALRLGNRRRK